MVDYARWHRDVTDVLGNLRAGEVVNVEVRKESDGLLATIYSGRTGGALANPFTVSDGLAAFHAAASPGGYKVRLYVGASLSPASERTLRYEPVGLLAESDGTFPGVALLTDGSAAAPALAFASDTDTGIYRAAANRLAIAAGGVGVFFVDSIGFGLGGLNADSLFTLSKTFPTGAGSTVYGLRFLSTIPSVVTAAAVIFQSIPSTEAAAFSVGDLQHYTAQINTVGAGSTITQTQGFVASSTLGTKATTAYGFRGNIAAGSGKWNAYFDGTAANYMAGALGIGSTSVGSTSGVSLRIARAKTGATTANDVLIEGIVASDVTTAARMFVTAPATQAAAFTLSELVHFFASQGTIGAGSAVTSQFGFSVSSSLTGATNNYGFYGNIAAAANRWNTYMAGTARNYMAGALSIGATGDPGSGGLLVNGDSVVGGYLRVGSTSAPANTTAGDLTSVRLSVGNTAFSGSANFFALSGSLTETASTASVAVGFFPTISPASSSAASFRVFYISNNINTAQNLTSTTALAAGYFENRIVNAGTVAAATGVTAFGLFLTSSAASLGTVTTTQAFMAYPVSSASNALTSTITAAFGLRVNNSPNAGSGPLTITGQGGVGIDALTSGSNNTYLLLGTLTIPSGNWGVYESSSYRNYLAGQLSIGSTADPGAGGLYVNGPVITGSTIAPGNAANFYLGASGANGVINWDANDYLIYDKTANALQLFIGAAAAFHATAAGFGYPTGAGGTVTQATSKSTAVTLNKTTGAITMNNAALAAATIVSFTVNNSAIAATDMIIAMHESGGTLGAYTVNARATGAGTAVIDIRNNTAGSLSEALVIRFAVLKSVNA